ncbi:DUF3048 domain-containing protein [Streptomyces capparidis]
MAVPLTPRRVTALVAAVLALIVALVLVLVVLPGDGDGDRGGTTTSPEPSPTATRQVSPFTGLPGPPGPVLAVKIDNVGPARPQTGIDSADIVYAEQVEAGQSRLLAVFSSRLPDTVGPVRSARESDLELLRQFDRPALAYSGAQSRLMPLLRSAPLYRLTPGDVPAEVFFRGNDRQAPHNLYVRPERALAAAPDASTARDIGFRFGSAPPGGRQVVEETVRYPGASFAFTWSQEQRRWLVGMDGEPAVTTDGRRLSAVTVVVQHVTVRPSQFQDRWGSVSPFTETVGSGTALVLRDGKAYDARWSRESAAHGTTFTTPGGDPLRFPPGQVWVVFTAR